MDSSNFLNMSLKKTSFDWKSEQNLCTNYIRILIGRTIIYNFLLPLNVNNNVLIAGDYPYIYNNPLNHRASLGNKYSQKNFLSLLGLMVKNT